MRRASLAVVLPFVLVFVLASTATHAGLWYEEYDAAEKALAAGHWATAAERLQIALQQRPEPGVNLKTYGMNFINYHPYLKLGIAYYNLGRYDAALQAFDAEERAGAIARSPTDRKNLESFRELVVDAKAAGGAAERDRLAQALTESLEQLRRLEQEGRLEDALASASRALAADSGNAQASAAAERIRQKIASRGRERELDARVAKLVQDGRQHFAAGRFEEASSAFNQALAGKRTPEIQALLDESRDSLRAEIEKERSSSERADMIASALRDAGSLEGEARYAEALARIQTALALDASNAAARSALDRIQKLQAKLDTAQARTGEIAQLVSDGLGLLDRGLPEQAAAAFNRVLALDPENVDAKKRLIEAFQRMSSSIGAGATAPKLIPIILLAAAQSTAPSEDGAPAETAAEDVETTQAAPFNLAGGIVDDGPEVTVAFFLEHPGAPSGGAPFATRALRGTPVGNLYSFTFAEPFRLPTGVVGLRVVATDDDELSGQATRLVRYVRPWHRSPWPYALGATLTAVAIGAAWSRRARRRRLAITRRFNPYVAGTPVLKDDLFFGREALVGRVLQTVHNNSILLYGERRIGKTSLQHQIKKRLQQLEDPEYHFYAVYVDLQGVSQEKFFSTLGAETFHELAPWLPASLANKDPRSDEAYGYESFVRDLREALKFLSSTSAKKVKLVLLIDEVDELNSYDPRVNQRLRSLFMKSFAESLAAVVSGVAIKKHWESEGSPWYNFFEEVEVKPFARRDAVDLIERPIRGIFQLESGVTDRIIEMTDCKPYLIQKLCIALVNRLHEQQRRRITLGDVEAIGRPVEA